MLTRTQIIELLESIDVSGLPFECTLMFNFTDESHEGCVACTFRMKVKSRDNPAKTTWVQVHQMFEYRLFKDRDRTLFIVRRMIRDALKHELDECFLVNGVREFDPHASEPAQA